MTGGVVIAVGRSVTTEVDQANLLGSSFVMYTIFRYFFFICYMAKINAPVPFRTIFFVLTKLLMIILWIGVLSIAFQEAEKD
jgi:hypothetical protein